MAGKLPPRTHTGGVVGYGRNGGVFKNQKNFNIAKAEAAAHNRPGPTKMPPVGHRPPFTAMPGHPSQNPTHYHGPSTTGTIKGAKPRI